MPSPYTAVLDACVLYPFALRDLLIQLATTGLFRARWTERIHDEWTRAVLLNNPRATPEMIRRTRELMDASTPGCLITGYEDLIDGIKLPDPDDRHILAAAIVAGADVIVTRNLRHFPADALERYGIEAQHPDEFVTHQFYLDPLKVCGAARRIRARLTRPPHTVESYLALLERQELKQTAALLRASAERL